MYVYYIVAINNESGDYRSQDIHFYPVEVTLEKPITTLKQVEGIYPLVRQALAKEYKDFVNSRRNEYMEEFTGHKVTPDTFFKEIQVLTFSLLREE